MEGSLCGRGGGVGVIGEAAGRADVENEGANMEALFGDPWRPLTSRRDGGDAGHVHGCARDHALDTACGTRPLPVDGDPHEAGLRRVQVARAALRENLRAGFALNEGQVATVLRIADALAAGVSLEAREALGREANAAAAPSSDAVIAWENLGKDAKALMSRVGERLFALGRASVTPPDPELARVIAAWRLLPEEDRTRIARGVAKDMRWAIREIAWSMFGGFVAVELDREGRVTSCDVDGQPAPAEQWAKLRAAGVPVADGVGV